MADSISVKRPEPRFDLGLPKDSWDIVLTNLEEEGRDLGGVLTNTDHWMCEFLFNRASVGLL